MKKTIKLFAILVLAISNTNLIFSQGFNSISTPDGVNIIAVGDAGKIFRSSNAGTTWASYTVSSVNFKSVCSINDNVWIAGNNGKVYKTLKTNSPINAIDIGVTNSINSICFLDDNIGILCGDGGIVYKTMNGGTVWTPSNTGISSVKLNSISFKEYKNVKKIISKFHPITYHFVFYVTPVNNENFAHAHAAKAANAIKVLL